VSGKFRRKKAWLKVAPEAVFRLRLTKTRRFSVHEPQSRYSWHPFTALYASNGDLTLLLQRVRSLVVARCTPPIWRNSFPQTTVCRSLITSSGEFSTRVIFATRLRRISTAPYPACLSTLSSFVIVLLAGDMGVTDELSRKSGVVVGDDVLKVSPPNPSIPKTNCEWGAYNSNKIFENARANGFAIPAIVHIDSLCESALRSNADGITECCFFLRHYCRLGGRQKQKSSHNLRDLAY
jgi:hypothetical protein